jgi:integrase
VFFQKRAGRSVWYDRRVRNAEAAGSNPARSTFTPARLPFETSQTLEVALYLKKKSLAEDTIEGYVKRLRFIAKNTDITNPETVKEFILSQTTSSAHKEALANAYDHYIQYYGLNWEKPFFHREERLPNVPTTVQVNTIISAFKKKYATIFSILRDTGLRPCELHRLTLKLINLENGTITPQTAKNGAPRILTLPAPTLAMLKEYITKLNPKMNVRFFPTTRRMCHIWVHGRNQVAEKLKQSNLTKYRLYDLRHYYATMLYAKTKDILLVKQQLGHKRIEHTLIYTHLINFKTEEYISRTVQLGTPTTLKEICELAEAGFTKFTEIEGYQIFKKAK